MKIEFEYQDISGVEIEGIDYSDAPDFCDAYISSAYYKGEPMTEEELEVLNQDYEFVFGWC